MTGKEHDEPLEAMLSADDAGLDGLRLRESELDGLPFRGSYIDDAGFTARVMERLPPRRQPVGVARIGILLGASATAALVLLLNHPLCVDLDRAFATMLAKPSALVTGAAPLTSVVLLVMLLFAGVTAAARE